MKKPRFFIWAPYYDYDYFGVMGPGFLNQVSTLLA